ncbi:hypothetical protein F1559_004865 [Cyanidiococcus yangmingshanensis]|uniref:Uncharacterized protein n=1 Tax=Cyanidiococcus yangmingshanensis TaxID=2690220 RepID=A0A7J7ISQ3_9RHOD|nr:hypothetical protein F1559_004865 [Cyanidiococcus yangmingshanensis]
MSSSSDVVVTDLGDIPPAPVFYPTEEEWLDPLAYVRRIQRDASRFGICKVIPPASWNPPKATRPTVKFGTRQQNIHQLFQRRGVYERFMTFLRQFHRAQGDWATCRAQVPRIKGRIVDLLLLYRSVIGHGGYDLINKRGLWRHVATYELRMIWTTSISANTKSIYQRWLLPLERYERRRRGTEALENNPLGLEFTHFACDHECAYCLLERLRGADASPTSYQRGEHRGNMLDATPGTSMLIPSQKDIPVDLQGPTEWKLVRCIHCADAWHPACYARANHDETTARGAIPEPKTDYATFVCPQCDDDRRFGYLDGTVFSYREYARYAQEFKAAWFRVGTCSRTCEAVFKEPSIDEVEREYWRLVDTAEERCEVLYGSELDVNISGSGFPRLGAIKAENLSADEQARWERYAIHPWNLNIFPLLGSSLLRVLSARYSGITDPWLYIGMCFATFCYHVEDSDMYSINYMHSGEGKIWYGCPGGDAYRQFENAMRECVPDLFAAMPDLLYNMITMVNPVHLRQRGAPMCRTIQMPGEFVLTFPQAFHGGFSLGVNMAEAVNFALSDWLPYGRQAMLRYREMRREAPFAQEEIVFSALERRDIWQKLPLEELERLCQELRHLIREELALRDAAGCFGASAERLEDPRSPKYVSHAGSERDTCRWCRQPFFLSAVRCACDPDRRTCVRHAFALCACSVAAKTLLYLYSDEELRSMIDDPSQVVSVHERLEATEEHRSSRKGTSAWQSRGDTDWPDKVNAVRGARGEASCSEMPSAAAIVSRPTRTAVEDARGTETMKRKRVDKSPAWVRGDRSVAKANGIHTARVAATEVSVALSDESDRMETSTDRSMPMKCSGRPQLVKLVPAGDGQAPPILLFRIPSE